MLRKIFESEFCCDMNVFDMIGPVMIGPSSSHTAGAARAGLVARKLLAATPCEAKITLYGSFAHTYKGHCTDKAVLGGILGFYSDDIRLKDSFHYAKIMNLDYSIIVSDEECEHPNTVKIELADENNNKISTVISSIGGGVITVNKINDMAVSFCAKYPTIVIFNNDIPGTVGDVSAVLGKNTINIAFMKIFREEEGKEAVMVIETDESINNDISNELKSIKNVNKAIIIEPF